MVVYYCVGGFMFWPISMFLCSFVGELVCLSNMLLICGFIIVWKCLSVGVLMWLSVDVLVYWCVRVLM